MNPITPPPIQCAGGGSLKRHNAEEAQPPQLSTLHTLLCGSIAGMAGRLGTNNLTKMTAHYQSGAFKLDLKFSTLTNLLIGSNLQVATTYGLKSLLACDSSPPGSTEAACKYFIAGAAGGLLIHPSSVAFLMSDHPTLASPPPASPRAATSLHSIVRKIPELNGISTLLKQQPKWLARGVSTRLLLSGTDWATYFTLRDRINNHSDGSEAARQRADGLAAISSTLLTTPIYQIYIQKIQGTSEPLSLASMRDTLHNRSQQLINTLHSPTRLKPTFSSTAMRLGIANIAFNSIATLERLIVDKSERMLEHHFYSAQASH